MVHAHCIHTGGAIVTFVTKDDALKPSDTSLIEENVPDLLRYSIFKIESPLKQMWTHAWQKKKRLMNKKMDNDHNLIYIFVTLGSQN